MSYDFSAEVSTLCVVDASVYSPDIIWYHWNQLVYLFDLVQLKDSLSVRHGTVDYAPSALNHPRRRREELV